MNERQLNTILLPAAMEWIMPAQGLSPQVKHFANEIRPAAGSSRMATGLFVSMASSKRVTIQSIIDDWHLDQHQLSDQAKDSYEQYSIKHISSGE